MKLTELEKQSALWRRLEEDLNEQLSALRSQNDGDLDPMATARLRGRIAAMKTILAYGADREPVQPGID